MSDSTHFFSPDKHVFDPSNCDRILHMASSKGNQCKWEFQDKVYKEDDLGYEGLSEVLCSQLAKQTSLIEYGVVEYFPCLINHNGVLRTGCYSANYNTQRLEEKTLYRILTTHFDTDIKGVVDEYLRWNDLFNMSYYDFVRETLLQSYDYDIHEWLARLLKFDWLILNEDRHFNNISFFMDNTAIHPTPVYDSGAALLSDCYSYPLDLELNSVMERVTAKPFNTSFKTQANMVERFALQTLEVAKHVTLKVSELTRYYPSNQISRALKVLTKQMDLLYPNTTISAV